MINDVAQAIEELKKENIDFSQFDKSLLQNKEVVLAYMQLHFSNNLLNKTFPLNIDAKGMMDNQEFIIELII